MQSSYSVGLDFYRPYILNCKALSIHDDYVLGDAKKLSFKDQSLDFALNVEVIEHLKKRDGLGIIEEMQRVARKTIILTTPNGYLPTLAQKIIQRKDINLAGLETTLRNLDLGCTG